MNIFPGIKIGDVITLDEEELEAISEPSPSVYWFASTDSTTYYHMRTFDKNALEGFWLSGRLTLGKRFKEIGGTPQHWHSWQRYTGATDVFDYCDCGTKRSVDWRSLGDQKRKD